MVNAGLLLRTHRCDSSSHTGTAPMPLEEPALEVPSLPQERLPAARITTSSTRSKPVQPVLFEARVGKPTAALPNGLCQSWQSCQGPPCQGKGRGADMAQTQRPLRTAWDGAKDGAKGGASRTSTPRRGILWHGDGIGGPSLGLSIQQP